MRGTERRQGDVCMKGAARRRGTGRCLSKILVLLLTFMLAAVMLGMLGITAFATDVCITESSDQSGDQSGGSESSDQSGGSESGDSESSDQSGDQSGDSEQEKVDGCHLVLEVKDSVGGKLTYRVVSGSEIDGHPSYFTKGTLVEVTAVPDSGYRLKKMAITEDGQEYAPDSSYVQQYRLTAAENVIKAEFELIDPDAKYPIHITQTGNGDTDVISIDGEAPGYGVVTAKAGQTVIVRIAGKSGDETTVLESVSFGPIQYTVNGDEYSFIMPTGPVFIDTSFRWAAAPKVKINGGHGTVTTDKELYKEGEKVTITVKPDKGYALLPNSLNVTYKRSGKPSGLRPVANADGTFSFGMPAQDTTINARFCVPYRVSIKAAGGGKVSCDLNNPYGEYTSKGRTVRLTITPASGYKLKSLSVKASKDGKEIALQSDNSFEMPESDVVVTASFEKSMAQDKAKKNASSAAGARAEADALQADDANAAYAAEAADGANAASGDAAAREKLAYVEKSGTSGALAASEDNEAGGAFMLASMLNADAEDEYDMWVYSDEAVFDADNLSIWVGIFDGDFAEDVHEEGGDILNFDADGSGLRSDDFWITPKSTVTTPQSTTIVAVDETGVKHVLRVKVTQDYLNARDAFFTKLRRILYLSYFIGMTDLTVNDETYEMWVPFTDYNDYIADSGFFGEEFLITEDEVKALTGTLTIGDKVCELEDLRQNPDDPENYLATFRTGKHEWGEKYTLELELGGDKLSADLAVKQLITDLTVSVADLTYNAKAQEPKIKVKSGKTELKYGSDWLYLNDSGNEIKGVGTYDVEVFAPGESKYMFWWIESVRVNPKGTSISKLKAGKKSFTVKWKKQTAQTSGYQIQYGLKKSFKGAKTVTVKNNTSVSRKIKKLKKNKKYYVRVRTYKTVGGQKYYSAWSKAKSVRTK